MKSIHVSIVEDDSRTRETLSEWLDSSSGYKCVGTFGSAEEALKRLPDGNPEVVLMDINLPGISGIECTRQLKRFLSQTQFIMVTMYEDSDHLFDALAAGASGYLLKNTSREALLQSIHSVFEGGSPMTGSIARKVVQHFQRPQPKQRMEVPLSPREEEILGLLARGYLYKEIAELLSISITTVNAHIRNIYEKMHVQSRAQAVAKYTGTQKWRPSR